MIIFLLGLWMMVAGVYLIVENIAFALLGVPIFACGFLFTFSRP